MNTSLAPILSLVDGTPKASSLHIADHFDKRHADLLRSIRSLEIPDDYRVRNFAETVVERENPSGGTPITSPVILMTRDGFTLIVMGFTGKKALEWKLKYIEAFNSMEAELRAQALPTAHPTLTKSTPHDRKPLDRLIKTWAQQSGIAHAQCWAMVNANFNLQSVTELPVDWIPDAISFVQEHIDMILKTLPAREVKALPAAGQDIRTMATDYYHAVMDANHACTKALAEVERKGRELTDAMGTAVTPHIGADSDPSAIVSRHKFMDAIRSSPRCALRTVDMAFLSLVDHAQLLCGLAVLGR